MAACTFLTLLVVIYRATKFVPRNSTVSTKDERRRIPSAHFLSAGVNADGQAPRLAAHMVYRGSLCLSPQQVNRGDDGASSKPFVPL